MNQFTKLSAILDANVLYPAPIRDFLLHLAVLNLYQPKWTRQIHREWVENLLKNRPDLTEENLHKTIQAMESAFPDANVTHYRSIAVSLKLPDENDLHVLAAAIKSESDIVVTFNTKDFPAKYLQSYHIQAQHPDEFVLGFIRSHKEMVLQALHNQTAALKNPPKTKTEVLEMLHRCGLRNSVLHLRRYLL
jgi:predicted nucleic acid-binding protein